MTQFHLNLINLLIVCFVNAKLSHISKYFAHILSTIYGECFFLESWYRILMQKIEMQLRSGESLKIVTRSSWRTSCHIAQAVMHSNSPYKYTVYMKVLRAPVNQKLKNPCTCDLTWPIKLFWIWEDGHQTAKWLYQIKTSVKAAVGKINPSNIFRKIPWVQSFTFHLLLY